MQLLSELVDSYRTLLEEVDNWFAGCSLAAGDEIACRRGCSSCCRGLFDITLLDAFLLQSGFLQLADPLREQVLSKVSGRLQELHVVQPDFQPPYLLNIYQESDWDRLMPDADETPCPLLDDQGHCLVYLHRPMTCRLHGIPLVDVGGEILFDEWCSENFTGIDPLLLKSLRAPFNDIFTQEQLLFREFTKRLVGVPFNELDTLIPTALLIDFNQFTLPESLWKPASSCPPANRSTR